MIDKMKNNNSMKNDNEIINDKESQTTRNIKRQNSRNKETTGVQTTKELENDSKVEYKDNES